MTDAITDFINAKAQLMQYFDFTEDYCIKPALQSKWYIRENDGTCFVGYDGAKGRFAEAVVVRRDDKPYVIEKGEYTLVVCIECVKIALILKNDLKSEF